MSTVMKISTTRADKALAQIKEQFAQWIEPGYAPRLALFFETEYRTVDVAVVWEEGPMHWTQAVKDGGWAQDHEWPAASDWPEGVSVSAVNHYVVALEPVQ